MGSTRFMVIKMKELIKTAVFAILGIIILVGLIWFFFPSKTESAKYKPGVYEATLPLDGALAVLEVKVDKEKIRSVELKESSESVTVFYPLLESTVQEVSQELVNRQDAATADDLQNIHTASVILDAVWDGLAEAKR